MNYNAFFNLDDRGTLKKFFNQSPMPKPCADIGILYKGKTLKYSINRFEALLRRALKREAAKKSNG